jgi:hypothetical protein
MAQGDVSMTFTIPATALPHALISEPLSGKAASLSGGTATSSSAKAAPAGSPGKAA